MRIISGKFKGRRFSPPADNWPTRPTTDFAKEGLFNVLNNQFDFEEIRALDLFGGTGSHSYELISRGCTDVVYVDKFPACVEFVKKTAKALGVEHCVRIVRADVFRFLHTCREKFDYIFAGPPYPLPNIPEIPDLVFSLNLLKPGGWLVLEHNPHHQFKDHPFFKEARHYGKTIFSIFELPEDNPDSETDNS